MIRNTPSSWGSVARSFHWILGFVIIGMIAYGWWMNHFPARADGFFYRSIHADIGYVVLLLMVLRVIWRAINPAPAPPAGAGKRTRAQYSPSNLIEIGSRPTRPSRRRSAWT